MLKADSLCKAHDAEPLFTGATFTLGRGERTGLVGPNGTGKSTLLRILAGVERSDSGRVIVGSGDSIGLLDQSPPDPDATLGGHLRRAIGEVYALDERMRRLEAEMAEPAGRAVAMREYDDVLAQFARLDGWTFHAAIDDARAHLGIAHLSPAARFGDLSGGEQARAMLAGVLLGRPTILLLDEPTNHLDLGGLRWLERFLAAFPGGALVVSHDRRFLDNTVSRILELDGVSDELTSYEGGYTAYRAEKQRRFERMLADFRTQDAYRRRLEADVARAKSQALSVERTVIRGLGAPHVRKIAKRVARKAKVRERRLQRQMQQAEWIADPSKAPSFIDHHVRHRVEEQKVRAGSDREMASAALRGEGPARVDADDAEIGVRPATLLDAFEDRRVTLERIGAHQEDAVREVDVLVGTRRLVLAVHLRVAERRRCHAQARVRRRRCWCECPPGTTCWPCSSPR